MLASEFQTYLTGRYISFHIYPFSFKEIAQSDNSNKTNDQIFLEYIKYGGLPQLMTFEDDTTKKALLKDLYNSIVIKDIVGRHKVRDIALLERYLIYLLNIISNSFSASNIIKYFKSEGRTIGKETLYKYIKYAKDVFFIYSAERYDIKGKSILQTNQKLFVNDQGFRSLFFNNEKDIEKILENIVYFELLRRGYDVYVGSVDNKEVDFIAVKEGDKIYIQVAYVLAEERTIKREFGSLLEIEDQYPKYVISTDKFDFSKDGIIHKNIIDFLLE